MDQQPTPIASGLPMPPKKAPGEPTTPRATTPVKARPAEVGKPDAQKRPSAKRAPSPKKRASVDEAMPTEVEEERISVFLKIGAEGAASVNSCVACDPESHTVWTLDLEGHRAGPPIALDGVFPADQAEHALFPSVADRLVSELASSTQGVGCLLCYGQAEAGKQSLLYGQASSGNNFTPRGLPAPGQRVAEQRAPGLVAYLMRALFSALASQEVISPSLPHCYSIFPADRLIRSPPRRYTGSIPSHRVEKCYPFLSLRLSCTIPTSPTCDPLRCDPLRSALRSSSLPSATRSQLASCDLHSPTLN